ncbi:MAG: M13 family metallopeptidase [Thermoplasmata archaeon]
MTHLDRAADPGWDFYQFAAGRWMATHPVPADKTIWSGNAELRQRNFALLHGLLEHAAKSPTARDPTSVGKIGSFYSAALDSSQRTALGYLPVSRDRSKVEAVRTPESLVRVLADFHQQGTPGIFDADVAPDEKRSSVYALYLSQGGLSLPDRDYYLLDRYSVRRAEYRRHILGVLTSAGESPARARDSMAVVLSIETALARASRKRVDLRDPHKNYHRFTPKELIRRYPRLRWAEYFRSRGISRLSSVVVGQPEFFDAVNRLLGTVSLRDWKTYLRWHLLHDSAPYLHPRAERENFEFFHRRLLGQERPEPPWKRAANLVDRWLGEALGRLYVARYFPPQTRVRVLDLVEDVRAVFRARLDRVPWMTATTRRRAIAKLDRFTANIGHPSRYRSYARLRISPTDHFGNVRRARAFEIARNFARIGGPVDRNEWRMTPPTVNAYFRPTQNQIFFPAGILQPPMFDPSMDDAVNYGGIATVIGHEITHGFDDQGRKFDATGNLRDWWSPADAKEFRARARKIIAQYSRFEPLPGLKLNGALTAGENIADLGGVSIAFEALSRRLADGRSNSRSIDGFTPEQRFFISYGQIWRANLRDETLRLMVATNPHSPPRYRVNGALANLPEFWAAFDIPYGSAMRQSPRRQVTIW